MISTPASFSLDPRLEADGLFLIDLPLCQVRLARDARYSWLVVVPRVAGASELWDLSLQERSALIEEVTTLGAVLQAETGALKINTATLGNIVRQLHIHVVARFEGDDAWPGPIWGRHPALPYPPGALERLEEALRTRLTRDIRS